MFKINHAIIMAAGRGSRMMPLTNSIPKAMAQLGDTTLIVNGIEKIKKVLDNIHITVGYKKSDLAKHVIENHVSSVFNTESKGNAWWIFNTLLKNLDEPIFVLTCDNVIDLNFEKLSKNYFELGEPACMVVPVKPVDGLEGDYIFENEGIITELNRTKETDKYCSGIQVLNPKKINELCTVKEDFYSIWNQLISQKQLYCSNVFPSKWFTVDTMQQLDEINHAS
jgi:NDP-sugar pyrophosphorylase family protein